jgi:RHS repeat-associated protein
LSALARAITAGAGGNVEWGLDNFLTRYFSSAQGRFTSPDQAGNFVADLRFPQTWNLYNYVGNNPLSRIDPDGRSCVDTSNGKCDDGDGKGCKDAGVAPTKDQKPPKDTIDISPQQVNVSGQQGSLWAYLTAPPVPRYVPNDVPLSPTARTVFSQQAIISLPLDCGGGVYGYVGQEFGGGPVNGFVGTIAEVDSEHGASAGG